MGRKASLARFRGSFRSASGLGHGQHRCSVGGHDLGDRPLETKLAPPLPRAWPNALPIRPPGEHDAAPRRGSELFDHLAPLAQQRPRPVLVHHQPKLRAHRLQRGQLQRGQLGRGRQGDAPTPHGLGQGLAQGRGVGGPGEALGEDLEGGAHLAHPPEQGHDPVAVARVQGKHPRISGPAVDGHFGARDLPDQLDDRAAFPDDCTDARRWDENFAQHESRCRHGNWAFSGCFTPGRRTYPFGWGRLFS
mmetsp:Transcript_27582/g.61606  ORF Transcript_27582/g.61606 Transcript_27582/m.61606 type:complete len:248 (+) Transcript_27582:56-799(+)